MLLVNLGVDDPESVEVRDAATVMLVRDGTSGIEVFMLRRNLNSDFVGGAYVFPGGGVDTSDLDPDLEGFSLGRSDGEASNLIGADSGGLGFWVAAVRETFEEAGYLLAQTAAGETLRIHEGNQDKFEDYRRSVDKSELSLIELCRRESMKLDLGSMHYFSRWVTPLGAPRRYDTRFFLAHPPAHQTPEHDDVEVIENLWIRPEEALQRHAEGQFELIFPTVRSLESLTTFDTAEDAVNHAALMGKIEPVLPTIVEADGGLRIVLRNDEVYDAFTSRRIE